MQKTLTLQQQLEDDHFADNSEDAEEIYASLSSLCPSENDHFTICSLLLISLFWEAVKKNCNNSLKGWRKRLLDTAGKSAPTKAKSSSTASSHCMDEWKSVRSVPVHILYMGSTQTKDWTSLKEVKIRLAQAHLAMILLAVLWKNKAISFPSKIKLYKSLVLSILLYGCESWMVTVDLERRIQVFQNKCYGRMLDMSCKEHKIHSACYL